MFSNMTIRFRLVVSFSVVLLFLVAISISCFFGMGKMEGYIADLAHNHGKLMDYGQRARAYINMQRRYEKDLFLNIGNATAMEEYKKKWEGSREGLIKLLDAADKLVSAPTYPDSVKDKEALAAIRKLVDAYEAGFVKVYSQIKAGEITSPQDANKAIGQYKEATHTSEAMIGAFAGKMDKQMEGTVKEAGDGSGRIRGAEAVLAMLAVILTIVQALLIVRSITQPLLRLVGVTSTIATGDLTTTVAVTSRDEIGQLSESMKTMTEHLRNVIGQVSQSATQVASASAELHVTSDQIATGAEEVASQTGTVATASEEMSATSGDIARNCLQAAENSNRASETARGGAGVVRQTIDGMERIARQVKVAAKTVEDLGARSDQIGAIVGTIEDIADQTNLLALNAAIEAARAGEQGRGFAVVADEVRALAERTTRATREIGEMIKAIQSETKGAVAAMEEGVAQVEKGTESSVKSGEALEMILNQINDVTLQVNQIATAAEEQTATTGEISSNIAQITDVVQATARGANETAAASAQLSHEAECLQQLVGQFKL